MFLILYLYYTRKLFKKYQNRVRLLKTFCKKIVSTSVPLDLVFSIFLRRKKIAEFFPGFDCFYYFYFFPLTDNYCKRIFVIIIGRDIIVTVPLFIITPSTGELSEFNKPYLTVFFTDLAAIHINDRTRINFKDTMIVIVIRSVI